MEKIEAGKLLTTILSKRLNSKHVVILSDEPIFQKCAEDALIKTTQKKPRFFMGNAGILEYIHYIRQNSLFEPVQDSFIILDEKFSAKKLNIKTIPNAENLLFVFGKTNLRNSISETIFPNAKIFLCYSPHDSDRQKCVDILAKYYLNYRIQTDKQPSYNAGTHDLTTQSLTIYNNNLYHCALHFERMQKGNLSFDDAKLSDAPISSFDIVQALLTGDLGNLNYNLEQYFNTGEDGSAILYALIYFFKQVATVQAELTKSNNIALALKNANVPYPAQNNIKKALKKIPYPKIEHFFSVCSQLELALRGHKKTPHILLLELKSLIQS